MIKSVQRDESKQSIESTNKNNEYSDNSNDVDDSSLQSVVKVRKIKIVKPPPILNAPPVKICSRLDAYNLMSLAFSQIKSAQSALDIARPIATSAGLSVDSSILDPTYQTPLIPSNKNNSENSKPVPKSKYLPAFPILQTTGGHSNTDHFVQYTGDYKEDRVAEMKRSLKRRAKAMQPEEKGENRWDRPFRVLGSRRRRIAREKDSPSAPLEPPVSGYVLYLAQMTAKMRHDNPSNVDQIEIVKEISKNWRFGMTYAEKEYYLKFTEEAKTEYDMKLREYRATGSFKESTKFEKLGQTGPWVRKKWDDKSELEKEISKYPLEEFKPKPDYRLKYYKKKRKMWEDNGDAIDDDDYDPESPS